MQTQTLGSEVIAPVRPHTTVVVQGGGGSIQRVPFNIAPGTRIRGFSDATTAPSWDTEHEQLAQQLKDLSLTGTSAQVAAFFNSLRSQNASADLTMIGARAIVLGGNATVIDAGLQQANPLSIKVIRVPKALAIAWGVASALSFVASVYHGYKRNSSVGWAIWWGLMGTLFPVITPTIAVAQGFAKPKSRAGFGRRRARRAHPRRRRPR